MKQSIRKDFRGYIDLRCERKEERDLRKTGNPWNGWGKRVNQDETVVASRHVDGKPIKLQMSVALKE